MNSLCQIVLNQVLVIDALTSKTDDQCVVDRETSSNHIDVAHALDQHGGVNWDHELLLVEDVDLVRQARG